MSAVQAARTMTNVAGDKNAKTKYQHIPCTPRFVSNFAVKTAQKDWIMAGTILRNTGQVDVAGAGKAFAVQ